MAGSKSEDSNRLAISNQHCMKQTTRPTTPPPKLPIHKRFTQETRALFRQRLGDILTRICLFNDGHRNIWRAREAANQAVHRALSPSFVTEAIVVTALVLLDRVQMADSPMHVNSASVVNVFIACVLVAAKWIEDYMNGSAGCELSGNDRQLHHFETCVLKCLAWSAWVSLEEYQRYALVLFGTIHDSSA